MGRRETAAIWREVERLAFYESSDSDDLIRLPERFKDAAAFKKSLWRLDLVAIAGGFLLFGIFLFWFGLWPLALFFIIPSAAITAMLANDLVSYVLWSRQDKPKYHERYRWERNKALADARKKLVIAQKVRLCEMARDADVFERLPAELRKQITGYKNEKAVKGGAGNVEAYLIEPPAEEDD
jgi:hypothetical protein